ncbi:alpha-1,3-galactosidase B [Capsulimonas corticalis]|uniref:Alpha-1,3-galactosidase B n=1 Tax=Capsulimonas corticalis TaxID=2219043 RepID=A0A402D2S5_9BACT|nr:right-handed parallel beta-helix repeat-containing protein [Capsulimonas corticalis]BDI28450.1 alpha-1,3-galactosidase B [Capsulimonas corticalis]
MTNLEDFFFSVDTENNDATPAVRAALAAARAGGERRLVFPKARYDFWPDRAFEQYWFISNNDEGLKRIVFPLEGLEDFEIDGQGSEFVFHGYVLPFTLRGCKEITLKNFSIDWARTFHSEAVVLAAREGSIDIEIPEQFPYKIPHDRLVFTGEGDITYDISNMLEFDTNKRETAFGVFDNFAVHDWHTAEEIGPRQVRVHAKFSTLPTPGNTMAIMDGGRLCPTITIERSQGVTVQNVTLYHSGGMGIIAQHSSDLRVENLTVTTPPESGRMISLTADATHFVNCAGEIVLENCVFENQMDDATNVHGIYGQISAIVSPTEIEFALVHPQQLGIDIFAAGDPIEFVRNTTLETFHENTVARVDRVNKQFTRLTLESPLPTDLSLKDAVANLRWIPNLTARGCRSRGNRARGFLVTTGGKALIENNHFHIAGAAILIEGDANYWFESGKVRDVTIRGNHFENCNYGVWGTATIEVNPGVAEPYRAQSLYHHSIRVENNTFDDFHGRLLAAHCVDGLTFTGNVMRPSGAYPKRSAGGELLEITHCANVDIRDNDLSTS